MHRAYSLLTVKAVEDGRRTFKGWATTPTVDRVGDVIEPMGATFRNPLPLLHQHDHERPIGTVKFAKPTKNGIEFEAEIPVVADPGPLKDRVDTAWGEIKAGLIRAVSIGFRPLKDGYEIMADGGYRFKSIEIIELSAVTVPANAEAIITAVKAIDEAARVATDRQARGGGDGGGNPASGRVHPITKGPANMATKTPAEQISAYEATRQTKAARMEELMTAAAEKGETLNAEESEEYETLDSEVKALDKHLDRLNKLVEAAKKTAKQPAGGNEREAADARGGLAHVSVRQVQAPPGIRFARLVKCVGVAKGNLPHALSIAERNYKDDAGIVSVLKTAVAAGTTSNADWAGNLVGDETSVYADFIEYLRPQTILGRFGANGIPSLRRVPFRTALIGQTSGGDGYWVGEGKPKPLTKFDFSRTTLDPLKVANIAVLTEEVLRDSSPSAEMLVRDQLAAALRERLDIDFIDPTKNVSAGVSPASITYGVSATASAGNDAESVREDIRTLFHSFIADNNAPTNGVFIMPATTALALSLMMNALGQPEFGGVTMSGGTLSGLPVITSEYVPTDTAGAYVYLVNASDIYLADDGGIRIDMSREASLQMNDNPTTQDATTGTGTSLVSLWQTNTVGFRAERTINWAKRRAGAVAALSEVNWGQPSS